MTKEKSREQTLAKMLLLTQKNPGVRPRELHLLMNLQHSAKLRDALIARGLVRKERKGTAVYYYPVTQEKNDDNSTPSNQ